MPRLPTIRVIGSQFISTRLREDFFARGSTVAISAMALSSWILERMHFSRPIRIVTGRIFASVIAPLGLFVERAVGDLAEIADQNPIGLDEDGRDAATRGLVHERHELVRETGH